MSKTGFLIFLIAFSITVQNTCPYGWAAKTAFAASNVSRCPMKENHKPANSNNQDDVKKDLSTAKQIFALSISKPDNKFQLFIPVIHVVSFRNDTFKDIFPEPLLRPPIIYSIS